MDEAAAHAGKPVQCADVWPKVRHGVVREVSTERGLVRVQMHYGARGGYRLSSRCEWWPPALLSVPQRWLARQAKETAQ